MREINGEGAGSRSYVSIAEQNVLRPRRKINIKRFVGSLVLFTLVIAFAFWGVLFIIDKDSPQLPKIETAGEAPENGVPANNSVADTKKVVLDPGHGGFDPGATGVDGTIESDINLKMAEALKEELEAAGMQVIMTRTDKDAIAATKDEDMAKRCEIAQEENPDAFISIHMNSLEDHSVCGPIVMFQPGSVPGEELSKTLESSINGNLDLLKSCTHRSGDLIVLRENKQPSVLVECGFISNKDEEARLLDEIYQKQLAKAIRMGLEEFFKKGKLA